MIRMVYDNLLQRGDVVRGERNLLTGNMLETLANISLFTDRRAEPGDDVPPDSVYRGGSWQDSMRSGPMGSRLWQLKRAKATQATLTKAKAFIEEAFVWFVEDGIAKSVQVQTMRGATVGHLKWVVKIEKPDGTQWLRMWEERLNAL